MQIPVLVESTPSNGFRARCGEPLPLSAEGASREEALRKLRDMVRGRIQNGIELTMLDTDVNPLMRFAGRYANDPTIAEWREAVEDYRKQLDEAEGIQ